MRMLPGIWRKALSAVFCPFFLPRPGWSASRQSGTVLQRPSQTRLDGKKEAHLPIHQALEYIAQHRTGFVILVVVMFLTLWLRKRK